MDPLFITSEGLLVETLDKYIEHNSKKDPNIMTKLKSALDEIRISLVPKTIIKNCENKDLETMLLKKKRKLIYASDFPLEMEIEKKRNKKGNLLETLPTKILRQLFVLYNNKFCIICNAAHNAIACKHFKPKDFFPELIDIYNRHCNTRFEEYSNEEIITILNAFKQVGLAGIHSSHFKVFSDYEFNLEP